MESELTLHPTSASSSPKAVVFLHGVNGSWRDTWTNRATGLFWPEALGSASGWDTFSIQYDANTSWGRTTMPLQQRAVSIAELLRDAPQLAGKDVALVAHSFGGIVTKQVLRHLHGRERFRDLEERIAGVVFVATPHTGADIASYGHFLRWALGSTVTLEDLRVHSPLLIELGDWYRNTVTLPAHVLVETRKLRLKWLGRRWAMVVDPASANPGLPGVAVVPVDADHVEICRPATAESVQFRSVAGFLGQHFEIPARLARYPRQAAAVCYRRGAGGVELLLVRTTGGRWTFPKGRIEEKLGIAGSAEQEALEEAGVAGTLAPEPLTHYLHAKLELKTGEDRAQRFCITAFLLEVQDENARTPERGRSPTWFSPEEAKDRLAEDRSVIYRKELARVVDEAVRCLGDRPMGR